eukprot:9237805-Alexandrium_andersonii.AAC.1
MQTRVRGSPHECIKLRCQAYLSGRAPAHRGPSIDPTTAGANPCNAKASGRSFGSSPSFRSKPRDVERCASK